MKIKKILIANRGEIAIRIMRAASELGIETVAIYAKEDRLSLHRFKADEAYQVGGGYGGRGLGNKVLGPIQSYLAGDEIIDIAKRAGVDAIHPGYGFLSENPEFADLVVANDIIWIGPKADIMRELGNKVSARNVAQSADVPVLPASPPLPDDPAQIRDVANEIGFPVMLKASWGGGGRGMRVINNEQELDRLVPEGQRESEAAFGNGEVYLEKFIDRARHVEVQVLGDLHGNLVHLFERDCSIQRRNQKVIERAPAIYLTQEQRSDLCASAIKLAQQVGYQNAGTVEFLMDERTGLFYFIEVNPRIQVEHTVTEEITGIDLVKAQILIAQGETIGTTSCGVPTQEHIAINGHAIQCRVTTEDPENNFVPDYGRISFYRNSSGFGVRQDAGNAYSGAIINHYYDSLLEKLTVWASSPDEAIARILRALKEVRIRGVTTNISFLENLISHPTFKAADYTTTFLDKTPDLFTFPKPQDRASKLLDYLAEVSVNGNSLVEGRPLPKVKLLRSVLPPKRPPEGGESEAGEAKQKNAKNVLDQQGAPAVAQWMLDQTKLLITDTTMRDAHQSLLATRLRTKDMAVIAPFYHENLDDLFSVECWGGATFDVSMRFLNECPWNRLSVLRQKMPNTLLQMLLRGANAVGYTNYPDNVVRSFVSQAAQSGIDLFRVFDSLNWVENMRVAMDGVLESGKLLEATLCYTGDILNPDEAQYDLDYYLKMADELKGAGAHVLGLKDMAGVLKPEAARLLISALKSQTGLPVHLHTHDTSGFASATLLAASEAGVDCVDCAMDSFSGLTSQANLGSLVETLRYTPRCSQISSQAIRDVSDYWDRVRGQYSAFDVDIKAGLSEVYLHAMPGGQYTNLKEQARSLGIEDQWPEIALTYAQVNEIFGNIVKVTPTSKVVGDMTLFMISAGLSIEDVLSPDVEIAFPDSVVQFFKGDLGQPPAGFPAALQQKVLKGETPLTSRPGALLAPVDLDKTSDEIVEKLGRKISDEDLNSYLMYPNVYLDYATFTQTYGDVSVLPTSAFFYGLAPGEEISVEIETGKVLDVSCVATGEVDSKGLRDVFYELNGQPRSVQIADKSFVQNKIEQKKADPLNDMHIGAPIPGMVGSIHVADGDKVEEGTLLLTIEAMKMETSVYADRSGVVSSVYVKEGVQIDQGTLLVEYKA